MDCDIIFVSHKTSITVDKQVLTFKKNHLPKTKLFSGMS